MSELPGEMRDPHAPPGVPPSFQSRAAPVWCVHGVRWQHTDVGYIADDAMAGPHVGHRDPVLDVGSIPCQPTYASFEVWRVTAAARAVEAERNAHRRDR